MFLADPDKLGAGQGRKNFMYMFVISNQYVHQISNASAKQKIVKIYRKSVKILYEIDKTNMGHISPDCPPWFHGIMPSDEAIEGHAWPSIAQFSFVCLVF